MGILDIIVVVMPQTILPRRNRRCALSATGMRKPEEEKDATTPGVSKAAVIAVVRECEECQLIDTAPVHWSKGALNVKQTWHRVVMDITHCNGSHFLMMIDCGLARFAIRRRLPRQDATSVINQLKVLFYERGLPTEILTDNDTAFRSSLLKTFLDEWRIRLRFHCAYVPFGNGIIERCHRTVKRIAARKQCTIPEAVYWYNVTPKDDVSLLLHQPIWSIGTAYGWKEPMEHQRRHITAGHFQTGWLSVGKDSTWMMYHKI